MNGVQNAGIWRTVSSDENTVVEVLKFNDDAQAILSRQACQSHQMTMWCLRIEGVLVRP